MKMIFDLPNEIVPLLDEVCRIDCRTKTGIARIAIKKYCESILNNESS